MQTLAIDSDNLIKWTGMSLGSTGVAVNDATVTWEIKTAADVLVEDGTLTYTGTAGEYSGICESTVALVDGDTYYLELTAASGGANGFRRIECIAAYQDED